ncbi:MarR family transcriptional regulator [Halosimplex pelagicum]|uniref:MarR family transcriptional regulator n=1 Tax=Halosimplex pelagicum TaxID=869886 RepID=A0A7D5PB93_9EURY|nr:MarR family transcriptional regulator [Halosimplex pelagicum]QLH82102.1 MarR family transcriptional regulator [Halosimplex pelagicum]
MAENDSSHPYPVLPGTDEYKVLSFLVRNRGDRFSLAEIASAIDSSETEATSTIEILAEDQLIERSQDTYFVDSECGQYLQRRLESVDTAKRLHDTTPDDDMYAREDWERELSSLDSR